jgi:Kef-type K+ transport system membrane component KefB
VSIVDVLFLVGLGILWGFLGGKLSNRIRFPAVIGYLVFGLILGPSILNLFQPDVLDDLGIISDLALGFVAFSIGCEMRLSVLKRMGRGILTIVLGESLGAFIMVTCFVYLLTQELHLALIFGAMAPASAPAGTVVVLQEYRAKGPLTNTILAVVGLDDGLAILIYALAISVAKLLLFGAGTSSLAWMITTALVEILGAIAFGSIMGLALGVWTRRVRRPDDLLSISLGAILLCTGLSKMFHMSLILSNLALGALLANTALRASRRVFETVRKITPPIYIIFFVLAGAHLDLHLLAQMGLLGLVYIMGRTSGLIGGSYIGAMLAKAESTIRRYLGLGILSQAGVAIGLSLLVSREFGALGDAGHRVALLTINTIAATTIVFEIIGPLTTRLAITKAGEVGKARK